MRAAEVRLMCSSILTFAQVMNLTIGPPGPPSADNASTQPNVRCNQDLANTPWYTRTCPRFRFGD
jgi:hypothetical protein